MNKFTGLLNVHRDHIRRSVRDRVGQAGNFGSLSFRRQLRSPWFVFTSLVPPPPPSRPPPPARHATPTLLHQAPFSPSLHLFFHSLVTVALSPIVVLNFLSDTSNTDAGGWGSGGGWRVVALNFKVFQIQTMPKCCMVPRCRFRRAEVTVCRRP